MFFLRSYSQLIKELKFITRHLLKSCVVKHYSEQLFWVGYLLFDFFADTLFLLLNPAFLEADQAAINELTYLPATGRVWSIWRNSRRENEKRMRSGLGLNHDILF